MVYALHKFRHYVLGNRFVFYVDHMACCNPTLKECEDETHTPKIGTWESSGTLESSEFDYKGQNTLHWGFFISLESY
jgi:hypothetical protein